MNPRFPVYIVSKGRWKRRPTSKMFDNYNIPYYMIVEEQEYDNYCNAVGSDKVLILPQKYKNDYDMFWNDGDTRTGPGPARNYAWDHSISNGYDFHWVVDDNIESIERMNSNMRIKCTSGTPLYVMEDFVLRFDNIALAGPQYSIFCPAIDDRPPVKFNTRIYSFLLIRNDIPYRWRGRYNEDTDLSIRVMKDKWCTVQFNSFLQEKRATQTVNGGNLEEFYAKDGTTPKSQMLVDMHPDISKISVKFNRVHHHVDYSVFDYNIPKLKDNVIKSDKTNEFGLILTKDGLPTIIQKKSKPEIIDKSDNFFE